jgi:long-chain acyl-CoA synthetase
VNVAEIIDAHPATAVALVDGQRTLTYGELRGEVAAARAGLVAARVAPGDRVALALGNTWQFPVALLAVLSAGAMAVPLNPGSPGPERAGQMEAVGARHLLDALPAAGPPSPPVTREDGDLACLLFTAGTAGAPRAAMLTHRNLLANQAQMQAHPGRALGAGDMTLGAIPLFHIYGLNVVLLLTLGAGGAVALVGHFDPGAALPPGVTVVAGVPAMWRDWLATGAEGRFSGVRLALSGAAALGADVAAAWQARGVTVHEGYGLTEASPTVTSSAGEAARPGSIGVPLPGVEVRLVGPDGEDVLAGDEGEVWVRGTNVFAGYWGDDAATRAALTPEGWLRTGDIAVADADGWLYLVDRAKDVVNVSGFKVYPAEVEDVLAQHPAVAAAAVVGAPHPHSGETVTAFVVATGPLTAEELTAFCAARLARYKCPTAVAFVDALPQGLAGKVLRRSLRGT